MADWFRPVDDRLRPPDHRRYPMNTLRWPGGDHQLRSGRLGWPGENHQWRPESHQRPSGDHQLRSGRLGWPGENHQWRPESHQPPSDDHQCPVGKTRVTGRKSSVTAGEPSAPVRRSSVPGHRRSPSISHQQHNTNWPDNSINIPRILSPLPQPNDKSIKLNTRPV